jgi:hypothetical protein
MQKLLLPHVILPAEYVDLLKANLATVSSPDQIFKNIRPNPALYTILENGFKEFNDGRGLEKTMMALGWSNFRDRMGSLYIHKAIFGNFPNKTTMELVEDIKLLESRFLDNSIQSYSRVFLLGFYLKLANLQIQKRENNQFLEINIPEEVAPILKISQARSEKIDWLILIVLHLLNGLGEKIVINALAAGKNFDELYSLLSPDSRKLMMDNLLAYGLSINEPDLFLYEKI